MPIKIMQLCAYIEHSGLIKMSNQLESMQG